MHQKHIFSEPGSQGLMELFEVLEKWLWQHFMQWIRCWHLLISWPVKLEKDLRSQIVLKISLKNVVFPLETWQRLTFFLSPSQ